MDITITFTLISALIAYVIFRQVRRAKADKAFIEFKIGTNDGFYYNIAPKKVPIEMDSNERIRIVLGFMSQLLSYTTSTNHPEKNDILNFIKEISKKELSQDAIIQYFKREYAFELEVQEAPAEGRIIVGRLFKEGNDRRFQASIPANIFQYQLVFSSASLLHLILGRLDTCQKSRLQQSLNYIADAYYFNGMSTQNRDSLISNLENTAYTAASAPSFTSKQKLG